MKKRSVRKRTFKQRDNQLDEIHELSCRGYTQAQIGARLGLSQSQICRDLEKIAVMLSPKDATERAQRRARLLSKMRHAEKELWDAWERSKQDKETSTKEKVLMPGQHPGGQDRDGPALAAARDPASRPGRTT